MVGFGNMGKAVVAGLVDAKRVKAAQILAVDPGEGAPAPAKKLGCICHPEPGLVGPLKHADVVLLAVKPQVFPDAALQLRPLIEAVSGTGSLVVSVMAGVSAGRIASSLGGKVRIVRAMPNTPATVRQGVTGLARGIGATDADMKLATALFQSVGPLVVPIDENLMDAFTAVAGSGPAYLFQLAEAMTAGAVAAGFDAATADAVVRQTLAGSAALLAHDPASPADLRARVTSKGGTTEAALKVLSQRQTHDAVVAAILSARDRGRELGRAAPAKPSSNA